MYMDERSEFCDGVSVAAAAGTKQIGKHMDLGVSQDIGAGHPTYLIIQVSEAFAGGTSCQFVLASDAQDPLAADGTETRHYAGDVFTDAQLTLGFTMSIALPSGNTALGEDGKGYERFLGMETITVGTHTAGAINSFLSPDSYGNVTYPEGNN